MSQPYNCPDCGAVHPDGSTCPEVFGRLLALEMTDPGFGQVHLFTVACYMIQHNGYSDPALVWMERQLRDHLAGTPAAEIRRRSAQEVSQSERKWKVTRQPGDRPLPRVAWSRTIADADRAAGDPAAYQAAVTAWARAVVEEMRPLLPR